MTKSLTFRFSLDFLPCCATTLVLRTLVAYFLTVKEEQCVPGQTCVRQACLAFLTLSLYPYNNYVRVLLCV